MEAISRERKKQLIMNDLALETDAVRLHKLEKWQTSAIATCAMISVDTENFGVVCSHWWENILRAHFGFIRFHAITQIANKPTLIYYCCD